MGRTQYFKTNFRLNRQRRKQSCVTHVYGRVYGTKLWNKLLNHIRDTFKTHSKHFSKPTSLRMPTINCYNISSVPQRLWANFDFGRFINYLFIYLWLIDWFQSFLWGLYVHWSTTVEKKSYDCGNDDQNNDDNRSCHRTTGWKYKHTLFIKDVHER